VFAILTVLVARFVTIVNACSLLEHVARMFPNVHPLPIFVFQEAVFVRRIRKKDKNAQALLMHLKRHMEVSYANQVLFVHRGYARQKQTTFVTRMKIASQDSALTAIALDILANQVRLAATIVLANKVQSAQRVYARAKKASHARQTLTAYLDFPVKRVYARFQRKAASVDKIAIAQTANVCQDLYLRLVLAMCSG
jgi:hypothetical protein